MNFMPTPKQQAILDSDQPLMYGGVAGGGMAASQHEPNWAENVTENMRRIEAHENALPRTVRVDYPCRYCSSLLRVEHHCRNCGAPDEGDRRPLMMAPGGLVFV